MSRAMSEHGEYGGKRGEVALIGDKPEVESQPSDCQLRHLEHVLPSPSASGPDL